MPRTVRSSSKPERLRKTQSKSVVRQKKAESAVREEMSRAKKSGKARRRRSTATSTNNTSERVIHLAMSPRMANFLRVILNRARHDEPAIRELKVELEDQLDAFHGNT